MQASLFCASHADGCFSGHPQYSVGTLLALHVNSVSHETLRVCAVTGAGLGPSGAKPAGRLASMETDPGASTAGAATDRVSLSFWTGYHTNP